MRLRKLKEWAHQFMVDTRVIIGELGLGGTPREII